jgi:uncharacterized delta-60 repeat protein
MSLKRGLVLPIPVVWLVCAAVLGASTPARAQVVDKVVRWWSFFKLSEGDSIQQRLGEERLQVGGTVEETYEFGPLNLIPPGQGPNAEAQVYSSIDGGTYWVSAEAPSGSLFTNEPIASVAQLRQYQYFTKTDANAQLSLKITQVTLEGIDDNGVIPSDAECPWREPGTSYLPCKSIMKASVSFFVTAFSFYDQETVLTTSGFAALSGWRSVWDYVARSQNDGTAPLWKPGDFDFDRDVEGNGGGGHARVTLPSPITIDVPLSSIGVGRSFFVSILATASTYNRRQRESYLAAKFRDPMETGGLEFTYAGLEPIDTPTVQPPAIPSEPAPPCTRPRRGAGTLQFETAALSEPELPGDGATVLVTRSGGGRGAVSVTFTTSDGTALGGADYTPLTTHVLFADGEMGSRAVRIPLVADDLAEPDKTVNLTLSNPMGCASLGRRTRAVLTILDDDRGIVEPTYTVGGTVTGLVGTGLVLNEVVTSDTVSPANGPFAFSYPFSNGSLYNVRVASQPTHPVQLCTVSNGAGTVGEEDVTSVAVDCVTPLPNGALDPGFGSEGKVTVGLPGGASAMALQADGKIVALGTRTLARYNTDGTLDPTFGTAGAVTIVFGGVQDAAQGVAIQPDGKIVVVGSTRTSTRDDFALARYNADGSLDTGFGTDGRVSTDFNGQVDKAWAVLIQNDGGIVVAGHAATATPLGVDNDFAVARYTSAGALDTTFGTGGKATTNVAGLADLASAAALQPDGKVVLAGRVADGGADNPDVGLVRYTAGGTPDPDFGDGGVVRADVTAGNWDEASDVAVQPDGKVLVAVPAFVNGSFDFLLARFDASGDLDGAFGSAGLATTRFSSGTDYARGLALQSDGKIVVVGQTPGVTNTDMAVARYTAGGSLDTAFDNEGKVTVDFFGSSDGAECVAIQADGKIVVGGFARNGSSTGLGMTRLVP